MIVAVESNFVIELAFRQEQAGAADDILRLAADKRIELVVPACSLFEPYWTLIKRRKDREVTQDRLSTELDELARSDAFPDLPDISKAITRILAESGELQSRGLDETVRRILDAATVVPLTAEVVRDAMDAQSRFPLRLHDATVFASIARCSGERGEDPKLFANRDSNDFNTPEIAAYFAKYQCKLLWDFDAAKGYILHKIS